MDDVKPPLPEPLFVFVGRAMVGLGVVLQQTPRTNTESPPASVTFPPLVALVEFIPLTAKVVIVGIISLTQRTEKPFLLVLLFRFTLPLL
jgi:hypothetical protein